MREAVEKGCGHFGVTKNQRPFAEGKIGGHDHRGLLVEPADQMEQQLAAGLGERQISEFVQHDEVLAAHVVGQPALPAGAAFGFEPVDQVYDVEEPTAGALANASTCDRYRQMSLSGTGSADQYDIALMRQELAGGEIAHQS